MTTTSRLPGLRLPTASAADTAAPPEMPTGIPSRRRHVARRLDGRLVGHLLDLVDHRAVEDVGHEARADALDGMRRMLAAGQYRARLRLDGDDLEAGQARLQRLADAGDRAASADACDEDVELAPGVTPDLLGGRARMDRGIGRVLELLRNEAVGNLPLQLLGARDGAGHALLARRELEPGAEDAQHLAPLDGHRIGHGEDQPCSRAPRRRKQGRCRCCPRSAR